MASVASDSESPASFSESDAISSSIGRKRLPWSGVAISVALFAIALAGANIAGACIRGHAAADAAIRSFHKAQEEHNISRFLADALYLRAGRDGVSGKNRKVQNTAFEWARKLQAQRGLEPADFNDSVLRNLNTDGYGPQGFWGDAWLKVEANRILEEAKGMVNQKLEEYLRDPALLNSMDGVDWQHGLESMIIEDIHCPWVKINRETADTYMGIIVTAATQSPLSCGGHLMGDKYPFTLKVSKLWWSGRHAKVNVMLGMPFAFKSVKAGWIQGGLGNMEGTCYGKTGAAYGKPEKSCTDIMNKILQQRKGEMVLKMSQELTKMVQQKLDEYVHGFLGEEMR